MPVQSKLEAGDGGNVYGDTQQREQHGAVDQCAENNPEQPQVLKAHTDDPGDPAVLFQACGVLPVMGLRGVIAADAVFP